MALERAQWQKTQRVLGTLVGYSVDDASWTPTSKFDYPEELQKMIDRDNPVEDIAVI